MGDRRHQGGALWRWLPVVVVLALLAGAGAAYRLGGPFDSGEPDPSTDPAAVPPPEGLTLPQLRNPAPVASSVDGGPGLARQKVRRALAPLLADRDLGRDSFALVADLAGGPPVFRVGDGKVLPASVLKLLTTTAALQALGPDQVFETRVVRAGKGRIVLVGGGDPLLARTPQPPGTWPARANVVELARRTAEALRGKSGRPVRLGYDDRLFGGPNVSPDWPASYVPDGVVAPITPLWVDQGRSQAGFGRVSDPSATAAAEFAEALARFGVKVDGAPRPRAAPRDARRVASVSGPPLAQIVEHVLAVSDNEAAEVLAHHVGLATVGEGTFEGGADGTLRTLGRLGVDTAGARLYDGSGLSRRNRIAPETMLDVLRLSASAEHPRLRSSVTGLPVAGFTGSLEFRFEDAAPLGRGRVRAKTGTLTGVSSLAGVATDLDGTAIVFVLATNRVKLPNTLDARETVDDMAAALGACRCSR